jgi:transcriptional antiterminator RfaH
VIGALKDREDESGYISLDRRVRFSPGDRVRVLAGALIDSLATVEINDRERVAILLDFLGRKVRVFVGADLIAAA